MNRTRNHKKHTYTSVALSTHRIAWGATLWLGLYWVIAGPGSMPTWYPFMPVIAYYTLVLLIAASVSVLWLLILFVFWPLTSIIHWKGT